MLLYNQKCRLWVLHGSQGAMQLTCCQPLHSGAGAALGAAESAVQIVQDPDRVHEQVLA
jgi:hypothetical protein